MRPMHEEGDAIDLDAAKGAVRSAPEPKKGDAGAIVKLFAVVALVGGGLAVLVTGQGDFFVYSRRLDQVVGNPAEWADRQLRVEGHLQDGSVQFREDPCEWRFVLEENSRQMPVQFSQCIVPDTFRDHMGITVVVEGRLQGDGSFVASQVIPRCPSKYEMEQRREAGEAMPHAMPPSSSK